MRSNFAALWAGYTVPGEMNISDGSRSLVGCETEWQIWDAFWPDINRFARSINIDYPFTVERCLNRIRSNSQSNPVPPVVLKSDTQGGLVQRSVFMVDAGKTADLVAPAPRMSEHELLPTGKVKPQKKSLPSTLIASKLIS